MKDQHILVAGGATSSGRDRFIGLFKDLYTEPVWQGQLKEDEGGMFPAMAAWDEGTAYLHGGRGAPSEPSDSLVRFYSNVP